jgi:hypothetical protein
MSGYMIFVGEQMKKYMNATGNKFSTDLVKNAGKQWRAMTDAEKAVSIDG